MPSKVRKSRKIFCDINCSSNDPTMAPGVVEDPDCHQYVQLPRNKQKKIAESVSDTVPSEKDQRNVVAKMLLSVLASLFVVVLGLAWRSTSSSPLSQGGGGGGGAALLIIDVQNCFTAGGSLAVEDGDSVVPIINQLRVDNRFDVVVLSQDWHPPLHVSFASAFGGLPVGSSVNLTYRQGHLCRLKESYNISGCSVSCADAADRIGGDSPAVQQVKLTQHVWPDHCVIDTPGANFHRDLNVLPSDIIIRKGHQCHVDSYSAFFDNGNLSSTELHLKLSERNVSTVYVVGLATDYCVYYTAKDALSLGYKTYVVQDATKGVSPQTVAAAVADMRRSGITMVSASEVPSTFPSGAAVSLNSKTLSVVTVFTTVILSSFSINAVVFVYRH